MKDKKNYMKAAKRKRRLTEPAIFHQMKIKGRKKSLVIKLLTKKKAEAMHDLLVGLLCFDQVIAPIQALGRLHNIA